MNIIRFEVENVKRVKVVAVECEGKNLVVIGGNNRQGKTSALDAIKWALMGKTYAPSGLKREGAADEPAVKVTLSNGLTVERYGEAGNLKITAPDGKVSRKEGDLKAIVNLLSLDLEKFLRFSAREKADALLTIIGCGEVLASFDAEEKSLENDRLLTGRDKRAKEAHAAELPWHDNVPAEPLSLAELLAEQKEINNLNNENRYWRDFHGRAEQELAAKENELIAKRQELEQLTAEVEALRQKFAQGAEYVASLEDRDPAIVERKIAALEETNAKVRDNIAKLAAKKEADALAAKYEELGTKINQVRDQRAKLLESVELPLPGLSIANGELLYNGQRWDCMSGAEQLIVATSIVRKQNPDCGFVLINGIEQMDKTTLADYGKWLEAEKMQVIATRVGDSDECSIIIEDGMVKA